MKTFYSLLGFILVAGCSASVIHTEVTVDSGTEVQDAGTSVPSDAGVCSIVGTWHIVTAVYPSLLIRFQSDGDWQVATTSLDLGGSDITGGTYTLSGESISILENLVATTPTGCTPTQMGVYSLNFSPDCASVTLRVISDACSARGGILNSAMLTPL